MRVLVTGGCGFIGSHLVDYLVQNNYDVVNVDDCSANNEKFYYNDNAKNYNFSVNDTEQLMKVSQGCQFVFHLAAESRLQLATQNPRKALETNVGGTLSVLECCKTHEMGLVFSSTSSVYGLTENLPIRESEGENCLNPYASTKYAAELLIRNYNTLHGVKSTILRYFNVFGERAPASGPYALVTGIFLNQKRKNQPLTIVGDGTQRRDFIYVKDIVMANVLSVLLRDSQPRLSNAEIFNIGSSTEVSVNELANVISEKQEYIPKRQGEAYNNLSDNSKFKSMTGWNPTVSILEWVKGQI